jgi:hypothetical protein
VPAPRGFGRRVRLRQNIIAALSRPACSTQWIHTPSLVQHVALPNVAVPDKALGMRRPSSRTSVRRVCRPATFTRGPGRGRLAGDNDMADAAAWRCDVVQAPASSWRSRKRIKESSRPQCCFALLLVLVLLLHCCCSCCRPTQRQSHLPLQCRLLWRTLSCVERRASALHVSAGGIGQWARAQAACMYGCLTS